MADVTRRLCIRGKVQGVWYRGWMEQEAVRAGVRGWVRNQPDGSVEALVSGPSEIVEKLVRQCEEGPSAAIVTRVTVEPAADDGTVGFVRKVSV